MGRGQGRGSEGHGGGLGEHLSGVYLRLDHVRVDVHRHACVLAQLDQRPDVVGGQPQVPVRDKVKEVTEGHVAVALPLPKKSLDFAPGHLPKGLAPDTSGADRDLILKSGTPHRVAGSSTGNELFWKSMWHPIGQALPLPAPPRGRLTVVDSVTSVYLKEKGRWGERLKKYKCAWRGVAVIGHRSSAAGKQEIP